MIYCLPGLPMLVPKLEGELASRFISKRYFLLTGLARHSTSIILTITLRMYWCRRRVRSTWFVSKFVLLLSVAFSRINFLLDDDHSCSSRATVIIARWRLPLQRISGKNILAWRMAKVARTTCINGEARLDVGCSSSLT